MSVLEGSNVKFQCSFSGSVSIPDWKINNTVYYWGYISDPFLFDFNDFSLAVHNVPTSFSGTVFQCILHGEAESSMGYLTVLRSYAGSTSSDFITRSSHVQSSIANSKEYSYTGIIIYTVSYSYYFY